MGLDLRQCGCIIGAMTNDSSRNLFDAVVDDKLRGRAPLAVRMRPRSLDEFAGQQHFIGPEKLLRRMLEADRLTSLIFFGPPGTGKTSLAHIIASCTKARFHRLSAPDASVKDIRQVSAAARDNLAVSSTRTLLFVDELHRFSRTQQDTLLEDVESGVLILIGATTENPFFAVNSPLLSRSTIFEFQPLTKDDITAVLRTAIRDTQRGLGQYNIDADSDALEYLAMMADGDMRKALTALEVAILSQTKKASGPIKLDLTLARESIQQKAIVFDPTGDTHYDLASALQKSMRGSDPDATVYWLARLIAGGEDPRFIARRIAVCAAEDVGNADPTATILAAAAFQISEFVGFPEAQLPLAQAALYVATAPKSNACSSAIWSALSDVKGGTTIPVPANLRDSHYKGAEKLGFGQGYKYPHDFEGGFVPQDYLGAVLGRKYYKPTARGREKFISEHLQKLQALIQHYRQASHPETDSK
jgi:putative ATPase